MTSQGDVDGGLSWLIGTTLDISFTRALCAPHDDARGGRCYDPASLILLEVATEFNRKFSVRCGWKPLLLNDSTGRFTDATATPVLAINAFGIKVLETTSMVMRKSRPRLAASHYGKQPLADDTKMPQGHFMGCAPEGRSLKYCCLQLVFRVINPICYLMDIHELLRSNEGELVITLGDKEAYDRNN